MTKKSIVQKYFDKLFLQINPVLNNIEREYGTDLGDVCKNEFDESSEKWTEKVAKRVTKHMNHKETFLEVKNLNICIR